MEMRRAFCWVLMKVLLIAFAGGSLGFLLTMAAEGGDLLPSAIIIEQPGSVSLQNTGDKPILTACGTSLRVGTDGQERQWAWVKHFQSPLGFSYGNSKPLEPSESRDLHKGEAYGFAVAGLVFSDLTWEGDSGCFQRHAKSAADAWACVRDGVGVVPEEERSPARVRSGFSGSCELLKYSLNHWEGAGGN